MKMTAFLFLLIVATAIGAQMDAKPCLPRVSRKIDMKTPFFLAVYQDRFAPPEKVGTLLPDDRIVGLNGYRVSSIREFHYVRSFDILENAPYRLQVIRKGVLKDLVLREEYIFPYDRPKVKPNTEVIETVSAAGLDPLALMKNRLGYRPYPGSMAAYEMLPGPCHRELGRLLAGNAAQKAWAKTFLGVYLDICVEKYPQALASGQQLLNSAKGVDPLTLKVLTFYVKVAQRQPNEKAFPLKFYGVTDQFAAFYYPYPILPYGKIGKIFAGIPKLQQLMEKKLYGTRKEARAALKDYSWMTTWKRGKAPRDWPFIRYVDNIGRSILDPSEHGGWPFRSRLVHDKRMRKQFLQYARKRFKNASDCRFLVACAMVMVGMFDGSHEDVKKGQEYIAGLGPMAMFYLDDMAWKARNSGYLRSAMNSKPFTDMFDKYVLERNDVIAQNKDFPGVYKFLNNYCPYLYYRSLSGFNAVLYWGDWRRIVSAKPWHIVAALQGTRTCREMEETITRGIASNDPAEVEEAFRCATIKMYCHGYRGFEIKSYHELAKKTPRPVVFHSAVEVVARLIFDGERRSGLEYYRIVSMLDKAQETDYELLCEEIATWRKTTPNLAKKAATLLQDNGSPMVCLKIAETLDDLGQKQEARRYWGLASNYYLGLPMVFYDDGFFYVYSYLELYYDLATDLCSVKGTHSWLASFFKNNRLETEAFLLPSAMQAYAFLGIPDVRALAIDLIDRALKKPPPKDKWRKKSLWYKGKRMSSMNHDFPLALADEILASSGYDDDKKDRLRGILTKWRKLHDKGPLPAQCSIMHAVPVKNPITIDGDLSEWDLSGQVQVSPDLRYYTCYGARIGLAHDKDALYVGIHFNETTPMRNSYPAPQAPKGKFDDSATLRFRCGDMSSSILSWYSKDWRKPIIYYQHGKDPKNPEGGRLRKSYSEKGKMGGFDLAYLEVPGGYVQEMRIPWNTITNKKTSPKENFKMSIQLNWGSGDTDWTFHANLRDGVLNKPDIWKNTDNYGDVVLSPKGDLKLPPPAWMEVLDFNVLKTFVSIKSKSRNLCSLRPVVGSTTLIAASKDGNIEFWDYQKKRVAKTLKSGHKKLQTMTCSWKGDIMATAGADGLISIWNGKKKLRSMKGHSRPVWDLALSPDGKNLLSTGGDKKLILWDIAKGIPTKTLSLKQSARKVAYTNEGAQFAVGSADGTVSLYDAKTCTLKSKLKGHQFSVSALSFSPDGKLLASASGLTIIVWDMATGKTIKKLIGHTAPISGLFFPRAEILVSTAGDGVLRQWHPKKGEWRILYRSDAPINTMFCDPWSNTIGFITSGARINVGKVE